jgi:hypothetical protein
MKQALEALESTGLAWPQVKQSIAALCLAIEQAEKQEPGPLVNIELSRRMAAVKVSNFYGSIIKDAEKEIERLHGLVLQHTTPPQRQPLTNETLWEMWVESPSDVLQFARIIERAHGIGGGE